MRRQSPDINKWLIPLSWIYGIGMYFWRKLFDWKINRREQFDIPVICVGNLTVGGTGKTPHIEYLIRLLKNKYTVAVLSRGYKRQTQDFLLATNDTSFREIGDEPFQIKEKFPDVIVAVDENRRRGINNLLKMRKKPDIVLLDDAYQHLYVKPSLSIVLTDYNRPIYEDALLPAGRLREKAHNIDRASIIIMTKCPKVLKPIDMKIIMRDLGIFPYQTLLFTRIEYGNLISLFNHTDLFNREELPIETIKDKKVLLVTGIASTTTIEEKIKSYTKQVEMLSFPDHHDFTSENIENIEKKYASLGNDAITIVTEKDAVRLIGRNDISESLKRSMYYLPIQIEFLNEEETNIFNNKILDHVREISRNSKLHQK